MTTIRNLVFDLDGTLIDSSNGVVEAVNYSLRQTGQPEQSPAEIKPYIGYPLEEMYSAFTDAPVGELKEHFRIKAIEVMVRSTVSLNGVQSVLLRLREAGYRLAVATTKIRPHVDGIITKLGWDSIFDTRVGGDEVDRVKPHPEAFMLALQRLGVRSQEALAVGDTINDVLAARAVPMKVAAVASPYGRRKEVVASGPDFFIESIGDLPALLGDSSLYE